MTSQIQWRSRATLALLAVLLAYVLLSVKRSEARPLWFDELSTLNVAAQPTLAGMLRVEVTDANPPLQYMLLWPLVRLFGLHDLVLRLPSLCFFALAIVCVYVFVGRRFGGAAGLLSATLLLFSPLSDFGVEARPYALMMGLTGLLLVLWQQAAAIQQRRTGTLIALAGTVFALVIAYPLGCVWAAVPLLTAELFRVWHTRRVDRAMLVAGLAGFAALPIPLAFARATQRAIAGDAGHSFSAIAQPTLSRFAEALRAQALPPLLALCAVLGLAAWWTHRAHRAHPQRQRNAPAQEWVIAAGVLFTALPVFLFSCTVTHYFWPRYLIVGGIGSVLLTGMLCGYAGRTRLALAMAPVGLALLLWQRHSMAAVPSGSGSAQNTASASVLSAGDPSLPVVVGKPFFYPEIWWYAPPPIRARLRAVVDPERAVQTTDFIPELTLLASQRAGSALFPVTELQPFLRENRHFLLWHHYTVQGSWVEEYLRQQGYRMSTVARSTAGDEALYEVAAP